MRRRREELIDRGGSFRYIEIVNRRRFQTLIRRALPLLILCGSARAAEASWRELLNQAERFSREGRNEDSVKAAQGALADAERSLGPEAPETVHILARLSRFYEDAGDDSQSPGMEKRLSAIKSKDFEAWLALGRILRGNGKPREAEDALKKALARSPDDLEAEDELARACDDMDRFAEEASLLKKMIERRPQDYPLYSRLAKAYARLGRAAEAKEVYARARKIDGKAAAAYIEEGYFHLRSGEAVQAREEFESAIALDTANPLGYHHLGVFLGARGEYPEAEKNFRRALEGLEADPNTPAFARLETISWLGNSILSQGRPADAEAVLRKCLAGRPTPASVYVWCLRTLGDAYDSQGKTAQAEETFKRAVDACEAGPACSCRGWARVGLGSFYLKRGRGPEASALADQAATLCSGDQEKKLDALLELAGLYAGLGDDSKAEPFYGRILASRRPLSIGVPLAEAQRGMARLELRRNRLQEAEVLYRQAIDVVDRNGEWRREAGLLDELAAASAKDGKPQEAAEASARAKSLRMREPPAAPRP